MQKFFKWLDDIAKIETENPTAKWLERVVFVFLILMILSAPNSIAATQTAWLIGMTALIIRFFVKPRLPRSQSPLRFKTPLDYALWAFLLWSFVTSVASFAPDISLDRLRNTLLFLIFYFVVGGLRTVRFAKFLAFAMIFSAMVSVIWTPIQRIFGRGVEIHGVSANSPLTKAIYLENNSEKIVLKDGDTLLEVNNKKIYTPEDLVNEIEQNETVQIKFYRPDYYLPLQLKRADLLSGTTALEKLGIESWKRSRNWRSTGFYGHYTTFAEVLQLILSLTFGLLIASLGRKKDERGSIENHQKFFLSRLFASTYFLLFCVAAMCFALLLTVTRASQLGFLISAFAIVLINGNRKLLLSLIVIVLPVALVGLFFLQQSRNVGFFDAKDDSTIYRETVWREGFNLWTNNPRNFTLGVGMDSIKRYAKDWHLFDDGRLPMGHFHSTPLQLLIERGFPALLIWLWVLLAYGLTLWRGIKVESADLGVENPKSADWQTRGILLGCFGGLIGFFASGIVHYNLGDAEVAMVFFMLMGISMFLCNLQKPANRVQNPVFNI
ncbi:MAG: O-antigen ligase family protein [Acidobacteriota bacterium]